MPTEIGDILHALQNGDTTLDQVAQQFRERSWPRRNTAHPNSYDDIAKSELQDPDPFILGSFDEVTAAHVRGEITDDQYGVLAEAMAESLRTQDGIDGVRG